MAVKPPEYYAKPSAPTAVPMRVWGGVAVDTSAATLARNAVLLASAEPMGERRAAAEQSAWQIQALDRADGKPMWAQPLPAEPVFNGLCVDRDGRIVAVLRDGSVMCYGAK